MLSLFPQPAQFPLPEFQSLLVTGPAQASAPIHLALSYALDHPESRPLIISPSRTALRDGLASLNDTWIASDSRCGSVLNAVSRIDMLYPPTPVHLCMLLSMLRLPSSEGDDSATCLDPRTTKIGSPGLVILHEPSLYFTPRQESHTVSSYTILIAQAFATIRTFTNQSQPQLVVVFDSRLNDLKLPVAKPQMLDPFAEVQEPVEEDPQPLVKYVEPFFDSIAIVGNTDDDDFVPSSQGEEMVFDEQNSVSKCVEFLRCGENTPIKVYRWKEVRETPIQGGKEQTRLIVTPVDSIQDTDMVF
ncbi:hypothetical protein DFP72DRAFT_567017 [Ephemerocybe angulata]|uniref:Uncharacterized protein n=1 Tax=Ephemerocybe angulata TaxID=980116 RepID=A0A8H6ICX5_9AGAR|nr:hypothetical protein DFP72DRAFT_567017 [Tulosesus angulatus]